MCLQPIKIKNVNYQSKNPLLLALGRDTTHAFMEVPCGHCEQCVAARQNDFVQRIVAESKYNHLFFATLTYDNDHLPRLSIEVPVVRPPVSEDIPQTSSLFDGEGPENGPSTSCTSLVPVGFWEPVSTDVLDAEIWLSCAGFGDENDTAELLAARASGDSKRLKELIDAREQAQIDSHTVGECLEDDIEYEPISFAYADIHDLQLMLKNVRDNLDEYPELNGRTLRYAAVSELGKQNGRPHFHVLFLLETRPDDFDANGAPVRATLRSLEIQLRNCVKKYWAENIGTRKNPVYKPRFKYARRWSFGKVYTNYDLHWVDPSLTSGQTSNVAYYVSKYMMKGSDRDARRQQFLRLNLSEDEYTAVWKTIRCRMVCSKGLGLDARFETVTREEVTETTECLADYANRLSDYLRDCDDLPDPAAIDLLKSKSIRTVKRRVMIPNFELADKIRRELSKDVGASPGPIFIDAQGNHRPLSHYYQRFGYIFTPKDAVLIHLSYNEPDERHDPDPEEARRAEQRLDRRRRIVDSHSEFDNISTIDMPTDDATLRTYIY